MVRIAVNIWNSFGTIEMLSAQIILCSWRKCAYHFFFSVFKYELPFEGIYMLMLSWTLYEAARFNSLSISFKHAYYIAVSRSIWSLSVIFCQWVFFCFVFSESVSWCNEQSKMRRFIVGIDGDDDVVGTQSMIMPMIRHSIL